MEERLFSVLPEDSQSTARQGASDEQLWVHLEVPSPILPDVFTLGEGSSTPLT